jgi:hypothetical protein
MCEPEYLLCLKAATSTGLWCCGVHGQFGFNSPKKGPVGPFRASFFGYYAVSKNKVRYGIDKQFNQGIEVTFYTEHQARYMAELLRLWHCGEGCVLEKVIS